MRFNPYKGFMFICAVEGVAVRDDAYVSIPTRVLCSFARGLRFRDFRDAKFQSLQGFYVHLRLIID
jgi:hypothetical protein